MGRWGLVVLVVGLSFPLGAEAARSHADGSTAAPASIARLVTSVPASALNNVGAGVVSGPRDFTILPLMRRLVSHGKPTVLSLTLSWCPHCAANSWALAVALSRFGALQHLRLIDTGTYFCRQLRDACALKPPRCFRNTHGLSFIDVRYRSRYLSFADVVLQDVNGHAVERPTRSQKRAFNTFDGRGEAPALDVGGTYGFLNSGYDPGVLANKSWSQIAGGLAHPHTRIAQRIDGLANLFTAAICRTTGGRPAGVCRSTGVLAAAAAHLVARR